MYQNRLQLQAALPQAPVREHTVLPRPLADFQEGPLCAGHINIGETGTVLRCIVYDICAQLLHTHTIQLTVDLGLHHAEG